MEIKYLLVGFIVILCWLGIYSCGINNHMVNPDIPQRTSFSKFKRYYKDRVEEGSKLIGATIYYSVEKTPEKAYIYKQYYPSTMQITHFITYADIKRTNKNGKTIEWYDNGNKLFEGQYRSDKKDGLWKYYSYVTGKVSQYGEFQNGYRKGKWTTLDTLGNVYIEQTYTNKGKDWVKIYFNKEGQKALKYVYKEGQQVSKEVLLKKDEAEKTVKTGEDFNIEEELPYLASCKHLQGKERRDCSNKALLIHLYNNMRYPANARNHGIQGTAKVQFVIDKNGEIAKVTVLRGVCDEIAAECERIIGTLPKWMPGIQRGEAVEAFFNLPIKFSLN